MKTLRPATACVMILVLASCAGPRPPPHATQEFHPPIEMLLKYDANKDGAITRAEMEAGLRADFAKADTKHLGCLDKDEVRAVNEARWQSDKSAATPLVDFRQTGCIGYNDFAAAARSLFDQLDLDDDGVVSAAEIRQNGALPPRPPPIKVPRGGAPFASP